MIRSSDWHHDMLVFYDLAISKGDPAKLYAGVLVERRTTFGNPLWLVHILSSGDRILARDELMHRAKVEQLSDHVLGLLVDYRMGPKA